MTQLCHEIAIGGERRVGLASATWLAGNVKALSEPRSHASALRVAVLVPPMKME